MKLLKSDLRKQFSVIFCISNVFLMHSPDILSTDMIWEITTKWLSKYFVQNLRKSSFFLHFLKLPLLQIDAMVRNVKLHFSFLLLFEKSLCKPIYLSPFKCNKQKKSPEHYFGFQMLMSIYMSNKADFRKN